MNVSPHNFLYQWNLGGLTSLKLEHDVYDTEYIWPGETLGNVTIRYRIGYANWQEALAFASGDIRTLATHDKENPDTLVYTYAGKSLGVRGISDFTLKVKFMRKADGLYWLLEISNAADLPLEIGDIALPLPSNKEFIQSNLANYTQVVARHSFISGHGSFIFWERPNGVGPYLVMTPLAGTKLEYYECFDRDRHWVKVPYWVYIHSAVNGAGEVRGTWRQPHTSVTLLPKGSPGDTIEYGFKFRWADDYEGVRDVLYQEGLFDVQVIPGMSVPEDLDILLSLRTQNKDFTLIPEYPQQTYLEFLGIKEQDHYLYKVHFSRLGENYLKVIYDQDKYMLLEFFVTQSLETLIKKRTAFLVEKQQHRDATRWYNGLFSVWDMRQAVLRGPHDTDGFDNWWGYVLACDDTALPKAPFIAAKNVHFPVKEEIAAIEYYLENFVWGKLQRTDQEKPLPYSIYGVPNWFENRYSEHDIGANGKGRDHVWRNFDYPHMIMLYYHMYQIARQYPTLVEYLNASGYLERAFGTAKAYFANQRMIPGWGYWAYTLGIYPELIIVNLIQSLEDEGHSEQASWLRGEWEKKVKYFVYDDPYPFDSEYPFDTTAFESSHAIAKYGLANQLQPDEKLWYNVDKDIWYSHPEIKREDFEAFMEKQIQANIALRGWLEPAYYLLGSDYRGGESVRYNLSYMSQAGGWAILDYAVNYAKDPYSYLRLGYASYLSSWALMNTGTPETNYGYWYPGPENDGATGWAITPEKYGWMWIRKHNPRGAWFYDGEIEIGYSAGLRTAATVVADDPLFGAVAYGGLLKENASRIEVLPRDGLRQRFYLVRGKQRLQVHLDWDGFAAEKPISISDDLHEIRFELESRFVEPHRNSVTLIGLPAGRYLIGGIPGSGEAHLLDGQALNLSMQTKGTETYPIWLRWVG